MNDQPIAVMWRASDQKQALTAQVKEAAEFLASKYGKPMTAVRLPIKTTPESVREVQTVTGLAASTSTSVMPGHLWLAESEEAYNVK